MVRLTVHVTPKSGKDEVAGWRGDQLCVRVTAAPEGGKANSAVERIIADRLGLPKSAVAVVRGHKARIKQLEIESLDSEAIERAFGAPQAGLF